MSYPAYPEYSAPSAALGVSYPKAWPIQRLRFSILSNPLRSEVSDWTEDKLVSFVPMESVGEQGGMDTSQEKLIGEVYNGYTYFREQDIVIAKITPCFENGKGAIAQGLKNGVGFGTTEFHVLRPFPEISYRWLFYLTMSDSFRKIGGSEMLGAGGQKRVPEEFIKNFKTGIPPLAEQQQIAAFLDWKTGQIDALIAKKQALMDKLKEKRLAVITQAVTKGLNPDAPLRDSGIPWLGAVPAHWEVKRLKFVAQIGNGSTPNREDAAYWDGGVYPWLNSSVVNQETVTSAEQFVTPLALAECHLPRIQPPAVLVGITGQGRTRGMATTLLFEATINQHIAYVKPDLSRAVAGFLRRVFDMAYSHLRSESENGGSTKGAITCEQIAELPVPVPPLVEQIAIAAYIDSAISKVDQMTEKAESVIAHLTEYRTALITAATTGQIDVRGWQLNQKAL